MRGPQVRRSRNRNIADAFFYSSLRGRSPALGPGKVRNSTSMVFRCREPLGDTMPSGDLDVGDLDLGDSGLLKSPFSW